jgi:hypothetical protein
MEVYAMYGNSAANMVLTALAWLHSSHNLPP